MEIKGSQFVLRPWRAGDEPHIVEHANDSEVSRNLGDKFPYPYTLDDAYAFVRRCLEISGPNRMFAIEVDGAPCGGLGLHPFDDVMSHTVMIGYWLGKKYWGRGIATEAVGLATHHAFRVLDYERVEANVFAWNPASARVLEKNGYTLEGRLRNRVYKRGELVDEFIYGKLRGDA
ncbi:MAG: GNAT family N-acetyltransferase [bacterium]|nr:GNAT family N-acetyltransferase [bacterium]